MEGRRRYKRDVFLKIHELMISEDQYRGRQLLLSHTFDEVSIEKLSLEDRAMISRAMAMYDTLGMYLRRGYLIEKDHRDVGKPCISGMAQGPAVR